MALEAVNITKKYGENTVLDDFSYNFPDSGYTCIMGQSGCGKSTLLLILMGLVKPDGGEVRGRPAKISAVFQEDRLCENLTVLANLRLVLGKSRNAELSAALSEMGLDGCEKQPVRELSGGMKRRLALLRALLAEYDVLFLDEPFKGLDSCTKARVMQLCRDKTAGKTVILVTHDTGEADFFGGKLVGFGGDTASR